MDRTQAASGPRTGPGRAYALPVTGALVGNAPGRALVAAGPFERIARPPDDQPALFAPDFFLEDPEPWRIAASWEEVPCGLVPTPDAFGAEWVEPNRRDWEAAFRDAMAAVESGEIDKLVPVVFAEGRDVTSDAKDRSAGLVGRALAHACRTPSHVTPYALWDSVSGFAGASPEILFHVTMEGVVETLALAGTTLPEAAESLLLDEKLRHEHELVIQFILDALAPFGRIVQGPTGILRLPYLAHLATPIELRPTTTPAFEVLVSAMHPTPALGGVPREAAVARLRALDRARPGSNPGPFAAATGRAGFGAPFGVRFPDGSGVCVVAIRSIAWDGSVLRIGAGAGLVAGSELETEWDELTRKIEAVRSVFTR